jgi:type VI secretion system protein ImpF
MSSNRRRRWIAMAGTGKKERLSPPLMYAFRSAHEARDAKKKIDLRDESGERVISSRRTTARAVINEPMLRREVARDLDALMNTIALESTQDMRAFDHVRSSILNFGFPDIAHRSIDEISLDDVKYEIATVLMNYEPRLIRNTIHVTRDDTVDAADLKVRFVVRADLFCEPVNVPIEFVAEVEVDTGKIMINRL